MASDDREHLMHASIAAAAIEGPYDEIELESVEKSKQSLQRPARPRAEPAAKI